MATKMARKEDIKIARAAMTATEGRSLDYEQIHVTGELITACRR